MELLKYYIILFLIITVIAYKYGYVEGRADERERIEKENKSNSVNEQTAESEEKQ